MTRPCGYFLGTMIVHADEPAPPWLPIISDGTLFLDDWEAILFQLPNQLVEPQVDLYFPGSNSSRLASATFRNCIGKLLPL